tara:strand:+ start:721 stop:972 length:252 start_codon:yes stop_codon:yes gene_type:complete
MNRITLFLSLLISEGFGEELPRGNLCEIWGRGNELRNFSMKPPEGWTEVPPEKNHTEPDWANPIAVAVNLLSDEVDPRIQPEM